MGERSHIAALLTVTAVTLFAACSSEKLDPNPERERATDPGADAAAGPGENNTIPFEPVTAATYVPKVKNLLTGLAPTDDEVQAVVKDPNALRGLIDKWMALPSFRVRMLDFLRNGFQQNQVNLVTLQENLNVDIDYNDEYGARLARNLMDSFPLTVWQLIEEGKPLTDAFTTRRYMMTTAMASALSYFDDQQTDDRRRFTNRLIQRNAIPSYTFDSASTVSLDDSLNPSSANYMKFAFPNQPEGCAPTTATYEPSTDRGAYRRLFGFFLGQATFNPCAVTNAPRFTFPSHFRDSDWDDWHPVTLRVEPTAAGANPAFFQLPTLRTAQEMTIRTDRLGFFGTLAFDANWGTNVTNEARVTANQSLIVAIGYSVNGEQTLANFPLDATDADHASNTACRGCHAQIDPLKQFFRQSYSLYYSPQTDQAVVNAPAGFDVGGVSRTGKGVTELANILATHPRVAKAWVSKLVFWANSTPALDSDPEVARIAAAFTASRFDFKTLVRETFGSPLITWASKTQTTEASGVIVGIARRDQFCASLSNRLGLNDVCGMLSTRPSNSQRTIAQRALLLPVDGYYRSFELPSLPTNPDLFFRQSTESICRLVADQVVDVKTGGPSRYTSAAAPAAIDDFVTTVMALVPSDPRAAPAKAILTDNFEASKAAGSNATDALKATFALACLSPTSVVVGL